MQFPNEEKIVDMQTACQYALVLAESGNVYSWGKNTGNTCEVGVDDCVLASVCVQVCVLYVCGDCIVWCMFLCMGGHCVVCSFVCEGMCICNCKVYVLSNQRYIV